MVHHNYFIVIYFIILFFIIVCIIILHMYIIIYITHEDTHTLKKKPSFTRCPDNVSGLVPSDVDGFLTRDPRGL